MKTLRFAICGAGHRSSYLTRDLIAGLPDVTIAAICDPFLDRAESIANAINEKHGYKPNVYKDHIELLANETVDAAYVVTGWKEHIPVSIYMMEHGVAVAAEVGAVFGEEECWQLIDAYERTKTPFMLMENCCFGKDELFATAMTRKGLFGKIVYCHGAYRHDLRDSLAKGLSTKHYRTAEYEEHNCDNYPTHDLGPIAKLLGINRGNRMVSLSARSSGAFGLDDYIARSDQEELANVRAHTFRQGDIVETLINCENGELISLKLDTTLPTYYSRELSVRGTKGLYEENGNNVFLDGEDHNQIGVKYFEKNLNSAEKYYDEYLPPVWKNVTQEIIDAGHGGMDYFEFIAFCDAVRNGTEMPIDVYDAAAWMSISYLSEQSIAMGGAAVEIPDFTKGAYKTRPLKDVVEL